jgi:hypothetical protein
MRLSGKVLMSLCSSVISAWMVITALKWPLIAALFPVGVGIPVFFMCISELYLNLSRKEDHSTEESQVDFKLSESTDQALTHRRTVSIFLWIFGFFLLIILVGFSIAIPIFFVLFFKIHGKEKWLISIVLAALAWACFFGLFIWLLKIPFHEGLLQRGLSAFGIL